MDLSVPLLDPAGRYPFAVTVQGEGVHARLLDVRRREMPTRDAFVILDLTDAAERYRHASTLRTALGTAGWAAGGALLFLAGVGEDLADFPEGTRVALATGGLTLLGSGFLAKFAGRRTHVGGWVSATELLDGANAHNAEIALRHGLAVVPAMGAPDGSVLPIAGSVAHGAALRLTLEDDGRVHDGSGRIVPIADVARMLGDDDIVAAHAAIRQFDRAVWL